MSRKCCAGNDPARLNKVGGQAVLEGVMMKAGKRTVTTCRKDDGSIKFHGRTLTARNALLYLIAKLRRLLDLKRLMKES